MPLLSTSELLLLIVAGATGVSAGFALFDFWRARQRLAAGKCSRCGQLWSAAYPDPDRYLVQGREVCAPCADALRDRLPRLLRRLSWVAVLGTSWIFYELGVQPVLEGRFVLKGLFIGLSLPVLFSATAISALALAARKNREALASGKNVALARAPDGQL
jgi:hypothetical protein